MGSRATWVAWVMAFLSAAGLVALGLRDHPSWPSTRGTRPLRAVPYVPFSQLGLCTTCNRPLAAAAWRPARGTPYLRAAHYFSRASPSTFWDGVQLGDVDRELAQIKADGFNAIVLVIPWPGFQVALEPPRYDPIMFWRLRRVLAAAERAELLVVARVGFSWQFNPDNMPRPRDRCDALLTSPAAAAAWVEYLAAVHAVVSRYPTYRLSLWSWEEASCLFGFMDRPLEERQQLANSTGFREFALAQGLAPALAAAVPRANRSPPEAVSTYWAFCNHVWRGLVARGREAMPGLTMELRVDANPVVQPDGSVQWQQNDYQLGLGGGEVRGLYWAPYWGASTGGGGEVGLSAGAALRLLGVLLRQLSTALIKGQGLGGAGTGAANASRAASGGGNAASSSSASSSSGGASQVAPPLPLLFLDQFNFVDNTPTMPKLARLAPGAVPEFLAAVAPLLLNSTAGYGLWVYRDYRQNSIYNPSFELGLRGWQLEGCCAAAVPDPASLLAPANGSGAAAAGSPAAGQGRGGGARVLHLHGMDPGGAAVRATRPNPVSTGDCDGRSEVRNVCFELQAAPLGQPGDALTVTLNGEAQRVAATASLQRVCLNFRPPPHDMWLNLTLAVGQGAAVLLDWVTCYCHVQRMGFRDVDGAPGEHYGSVRQLNSELDRLLK